MAKETILTTVPAVKAKPAADGKPEVKASPELSASVEYDFGETAEVMIKRYGDETVKSNARAQFIISLRRIVRDLLGKSKTVAEIQEHIKGWKPTLAKARTPKDPVATAVTLVAGMTDEQKKEFLGVVKTSL